MLFTHVCIYKCPPVLCMWKVRAGVGMLPSITSLLFSLTQGLSRNPELIVQAGLVPGKHRSYLSLHSSVGVVGVHDHTQFLEVCWRSEFRFMS